LRVGNAGGEIDARFLESLDDQLGFLWFHLFFLRITADMLRPYSANSVPLR
jgi:hypothetical protein